MFSINVLSTNEISTLSRRRRENKACESVAGRLQIPLCFWGIRVLLLRADFLGIGWGGEGVCAFLVWIRLFIFALSMTALHCIALLKCIYMLGDWKGPIKQEGRRERDGHRKQDVS